MKLSAAGLVNAAAWLVILGLVVAALAATALLGFFGLFLIGAATWFIGTRAALDEEAPTWGAEVFRARMTLPRSPEDAAAARATRDGFALTLRFYQRAGIFLAAVGAAGFGFQLWRG